MYLSTKGKEILGPISSTNCRNWLEVGAKDAVLFHRIIAHISTGAKNQKLGQTLSSTPVVSTLIKWTKGFRRWKRQTVLCEKKFTRIIQSDSQI
jgi:hypothetical protein